MYFDKLICLYKEVAEIKGGTENAYFGDIVAREKSKLRTASIFVSSEKCICMELNMSAYNIVFKELNTELKAKETLFQTIFPTATCK